MEIKSISRISFSKLSNPLHVSFMNSAIALVNEHDAGRLGIKDDVTELSMANTLFEQAYIYRVSERAQEVKANDCRSKSEEVA